MQVKAIQLGQSIDLKNINRLKTFKLIAKDPFLYQIGPQQWMSILRYGVVALWNIKEDEEEKILKKIEPFVQNPLNETNWETIEVKRSKKQKPKLKGGTLYCPKLTIRIQQLISFALGRSVVLEFFEKKTTEIFKNFRNLLQSFHESGRAKTSTKKLMKLVGAAMKIKNESIHQLSMLEKPDFTWDDPLLSMLYEEIEDEYELHDRYLILREKISTLFEDSEFIVNYIEGKRSLMLEMVIILLIIIEIILFLYDLSWI